jgi:lipoprotein NlpI
LYQEAFDFWSSEEIPKELVSTAAIRKGVILDRLGRLDESQELFRKAVRLNPDRHATYAELISFLVVQGRLENAQEFYRVAYNQDQIEPMWKIYYALWIEGLSLRLGKGSFPMARNYLKTSRGKTWQDNLARFFSDEMKIDELRATAKNKGQLVEVEYYGAILELARGKKAEATKMLGKVIASNMLGFFEYRMAREILLTELNTSKK